MSPIGLAFTALSIGCSHGLLPDCTKDMDCANFLKMYGCWERNFGRIQTPAYREALRRGANVRARISAADRNPVIEFLF